MREPSLRDSPRWCEKCGTFGDHHTDRHTETAAAEASQPSCSCLACDCQLYNALKSERNRYRTALREIGRPLAPQAANALAHGYQQIAKEALNA